MPKITQLSQLDLNSTYNYADYLTWYFPERVELIKGKIMAMSPAPNVKHQGISRNLTHYLSSFFYKKPCRFFYAPFDVRLYNRKKSLLMSRDIYTVVQPDLCVICTPELLDKQGCNGAPEWIIEILSKGNSKREMNIKYELYAEAGVQEYWIVYPEQEAIHQFILNEQGQYLLKNMYADKTAQSHLFPDLVMDLSEVFAD
ncbi:MAG: Uma2 family endonuclease [Methylococcaceae bacterium]